MNFYRKGSAGFTLLEIMVSLAIIGIALVTLLQLFSGALRSAKLSRDYSIALLEAKKKMDMIMAVKSLTELEELFEEEEFNANIVHHQRLSEILFKEIQRITVVQFIVSCIHTRL